MSIPHPRVLHITENRHMGQFLALALRRQGCGTYVQLHSGLELTAFLHNYEPSSSLFDLYLLDVDSVGPEWAPLARQLRTFAPLALIVLMGQPCSKALQEAGSTRFSDSFLVMAASFLDADRTAAALMANLRAHTPHRQRGAQAETTPKGGDAERDEGGGGRGQRRLQTGVRVRK